MYVVNGPYLFALVAKTHSDSLHHYLIENRCTLQTENSPSFYAFAETSQLRLNDYIRLTNGPRPSTIKARRSEN